MGGEGRGEERGGCGGRGGVRRGGGCGGWGEEGGWAE